FIWDILHSGSQEYNLVFKHRIRLPTIDIKFTRITTFLYVILSTVAQTAPVGHCATLQKVINAMYLCGAAFTSFLFFLRLRAMYNGNKYIIGIFFSLWLSVPAVGTVVILGLASSNIGSTSYCHNTVVKTYIAGIVIVILIHDTLVFMAISWRL
ncbi:hypothetical protein BDQ12DRAFT_586797, partial [Crucibulum laeve]